MAKDEDYKFGVEDLADKLGIEAASARIKLRNANVKKASTGRYGWKTKADMEKVAEELKSAKAPAKKTAAKPAKTKDAAKGKDAKAGSAKKSTPAAKGEDAPKKKAA